MRIEGVFHVLATPFLGDGDLDVDSLERLTAEAVEAGVDGLTVLGVMGEAHKLSDGERRQVLETVVATAGGRVPVVVGTSRDGTKTAIEAVHMAIGCGASGVMIAPPTFLAAGPVLTNHLREISLETDATIVLQDFPPISGVKLSPGAIVDLLEAVPGITCVKLEDPPTPRRSEAVIARAEPHITVLGGLSGLYLLDELRHGTHGTMTGFPFPAQLVALWRSWRGGDVQAAQQQYFRLLPLFVADSQPGIGLSLRKELWKAQGIIASAVLRGPGLPASQREIDAVIHTMAAIGLDKAKEDVAQ